MQDYYSVLGVSKNASKSEIKSGICTFIPSFVTTWLYLHHYGLIPVYFVYLLSSYY